MTAKPELHEGDVIVHRSGSVHVLSEPKDDGSGWWVVGGGGLDYRAIDGPDFVVPDMKQLRSVLREGQ